MVKEAVPLTEQAFSGKETKPVLPAVGNIAVKCTKCKEILYTRDWRKDLKVCARCNHHFRLTARERLLCLSIRTVSWKWMQIWLRLIHSTFSRSHLPTLTNAAMPRSWNADSANWAYRCCGTWPCDYEAMLLALAVMDFHFMGGSMDQWSGKNYAYN